MKLHIMAVTCPVNFSYRKIFIEIENSTKLEAVFLFFIPFNQFLVNAQWCRTRRKNKNGIPFFGQLRLNKTGRQIIHLGLISFYNYFWFKTDFIQTGLQIIHIRSYKIIYNIPLSNLYQVTGQIFFRSYGKVIFSALYNLSFICYSYCRMTSEEKIKARIEKLLFLAIFIVGFLSGFSFLIPYLKHLNDKPIVSGIVDFEKKTLGAETAKGEVIGFLPYWIISEKTPVYPQNLTQLIYFNVEADEKGNLLLNDKNGNLTPEWKFFFTDYFQDLKTQAQLAETKVLVAVTNFNIESIDKLIRSKTAGANFASNIAGLLANFDLDGINIDFEYTTDEKLPDSFYLSKFLTELRSEMNKAKKENILSIDLMANALVKNADFDCKKLPRALIK